MAEAVPNLAHHLMIKIQGAAENNLKNVDCEIPRGQFVVITGPSGSGKTSLIFDCLYREAKRRFSYPWLLTGSGHKSKVAYTLSAIRPRVDSITGLSSVVALNSTYRKSPPALPLVNIAGFFEHLSVLYFYLGMPHCVKCDAALHAYSRSEMVNFVLSHPKEFSARISASLGVFSLTKLKSRFQLLAESGYVKVLVDDELYSLSQVEYVFEDDEKSYQLGVVIDQLQLNRKSVELRLHEAINLACDLTESGVEISFFDNCKSEVEKITLVEKLTCRQCGESQVRLEMSDYICDLNARLRPELAVRRLGGTAWQQILDGTIDSAMEWLSAIEQDFLSVLTEQGKDKPKKLVHSFNLLRAALQNFCNLGLGYLELNRQVAELSAGEFQRVGIARELTSGASSQIYLLDEPTIGLHPRDTSKLLMALKRIVSGGASVIVIEHDREVIKAADFIIQMGPGAGSKGGEVVSSSFSPQHALQDKGYLRNVAEKDKEIGGEGKIASSDFLICSGMNKHNLKEVTLKIPLGQLIAVAGVSGSGKSTAIRRVLFPIIKELLFLRRELSKAKIKKIVRNNGATAIGGWEKIQEIVDVGDFKCFVGKRSIVATASGILGPLRELFARTVEARMLGYTARSFLFTESGSCCERCLGSGELVFVAGRGELAAKCMQCQGSRYNSRILQIKYKNYSIADVLSMTVAECREHFGRVPRIRHVLHRLESFGLGYLKLSQHTKTLSHGEQQRLRLCMNFSERVGKHVLYLFDEPTRGLQSTEIEQLYRVLRRLVKGNNSVIVIEHNPEIIAAADYIVEFGAGAGRSGGSIIAEGIPAEIRVNSNSLIGEYLQSVE